MADYSEKQVIVDIISDLEVELKKTDDQYDAELLAAKVIGAYREVRTARQYPSHYTEDAIDADLENYYVNIRNIALYDYNTIGIEWQKTNKENQVSREFVKRAQLFYGVLPLSQI